MYKSAILFVMVVLVLFCYETGQAQSLGTAFKYQGRLMDGGVAANGSYDFLFGLFDAAEGAGELGAVSIHDLNVYDGYFTVELDFGEVFNGDKRWLQIEVRPGELADPNVYTLLTPRQELTGTPYSQYAKTAGSVVGGTGVHGGGTANYLPRFTSSTTIGNSSVYEFGSNVGIGTNTPQQNLTVQAPRPRIALVEDGGGAGVLEFNEAEAQLRIQYWTDYGGSWISDMMVLDGDTGNIGIGTTTPGESLELGAGNLLVRGTEGFDATGEQGVVYLGDNNSYVLAEHDFGLKLGTFGATDALSIRINSGNVGIGTTTPDGKLEVQGGGSTAVNAQSSGSNAISASSSAGGGFAAVRATGAAPNTYGVWGSSDNYVGGRFTSSSGVALEASTSSGRTATFMGGNVGIGTTNPQSTLSVGGDGSAGIAVYGESSSIGVYGTSDSTYGKGVYGVAEGSQGTGVYGSSNDSGVGVHGVAFGSDAIGVYGEAGAGAAYAGVFYGDVWFLTANGNVFMNDTYLDPIFKIEGRTNYATIATIDQTGDDDWVGWSLDRDSIEKWFIGMDDGNDKLLLRRARSSNDMVIDTNGNVGVGIINPSQRLQVNQGNILVKGTENFSTSGDQGVLYMGDANHSIRSEHSFGLKFGTHNAQDAVVVRETTGNVGIGTTIPTEKLEVAGTIKAVNSSGTAVYGDSFHGTGVYGYTYDGVAIWGRDGSGSGAGCAGNFEGNVNVTGSINKAACSFKIDHPVEPETKYLYHSVVESPDMKNVYDGVAVLDRKGAAVVELPGYFEALNKDFRYQLTCIGGFAPVYIAEKISSNQFKIAGGEPGMEVSWQVTGIRQDAYAEENRIPVEEDKPAEERGLYLHPKSFGLSTEVGIHTLHDIDEKQGKLK